MRTFIGLLLRLYAYLYHLILSLFLLGMGLVASSSGRTLDLGMLPWDGEKLTTIVLGFGVIGLICFAGAITGWFRWLFPIWALVVFILMFRGFFLSPYHFPGGDEFRLAVWLTLGALLAFLASLSLFRRRR